MSFFEVKNVLSASPESKTIILVGQGGVGKSYSTEYLLFEDAIKNNCEFVYVGRYKEDIKPAIINRAFEHLTEFNNHSGGVPVHEILKRSGMQTFVFYNVETRGGTMYLVGRNSQDDKPTRICRLGPVTSILEAERFKRGTYPNTHNIFFDEFITKRRYINGADEPLEFKKILDTVARFGKDYHVYMCGNPDNEIEQNPYLETYNLDYDNMDANCVYKLDGGTTCFVKIAKTDGEFLATETKTLFGKVDNGRVSGEVNRPKTRRQPEDFIDNFTPMIELKVETPAIMIADPDIHRKAFYIYIGIYYDELYITAYAHRKFGDVSLRYVCRYDKNEVKPSGDIYEVYRFRFPPAHKKVEKLFSVLLLSGKAFYESDKIANVLNNTILMQ